MIFALGVFGQFLLQPFFDRYFALFGLNHVRFPGEETLGCAQADEVLRSFDLCFKVIILLSDMIRSLFAGVALPIPDEGQLRTCNRGNQELDLLFCAFVLRSRILITNEG